MNDDDSTQDHKPVDYTAIAVQLGELKEGQRFTLDGIKEIKEIVSSHGEEIGVLKTSNAVLTDRVGRLEAVLASAKMPKGTIWGILSSAAALATIAFFILDRLYGK